MDQFLGGGGSCICHDTGMCHYFGYYFWGAHGFLGIFWIVPGFLGIIFLGEIFFFQESPRFLATDLDI